MRTPEDIVKATIEEFEAYEVPNKAVLRRSPQALAAVGSVARGALTNPLLLQQLERASIEIASTVTFSTLPELFADDGWTLAFVLSPFKREIGKLCNLISPTAEAIGVVDTVVRRSQNIIGVNTNAYAAAGAVELLFGSDGPMRVLILGTGASSRSVAWGVKRRFRDAVVGVIGRSRSSAEMVVKDVGIGEVVDIAADFNPDMIINATTVGQTNDSEGLAFDLIGLLIPGMRYFDLNNRTSALQTEAIRAGCVTLSGIYMQALTNRLRISLMVS